MGGGETARPDTCNTQLDPTPETGRGGVGWGRNSRARDISKIKVRQKKATLSQKNAGQTREGSSNRYHCQ